jgi:hypothetical protein
MHAHTHHLITQIARNNLNLVFKKADMRNLLRPIHVRRLGWSAPTVCMACAGGTMSSYVNYIWSYDYYV